MQKILITGVGGYIGSITSRLLLSKGYHVVGIDNFSRGYREPLEILKTEYPDMFSYVECDLVKDGAVEAFEKNPDISAVIHFAALLNVGESWDVPQLYFTNNVAGTQRLLEQCVTHKVKNVIFSSSCVVYGNAQYVPIDEKHPVAEPVTPYGMSKVLAERLFADYIKLGLLTTVSLRYFNVCGATEDGSFGDSKKPSFHLVQKAVRGAMGIEPFSLNYAKVTTPDGSPIRDYTNVEDLADAHLAALEYLLKGGESNVFNLGTGTGNSVLEIIEGVKKLTGKDFPVTQSPTPRKAEADKMIADITKAKEVLGWSPRRTLEQSVTSLIRWYTARPQGWGY